MSNSFFPGDNTPDSRKPWEKLRSQVAMAVGAVGSLWLGTYLYNLISDQVESTAEQLFEQDWMAFIAGYSIAALIGFLSYLLIRQTVWLLVTAVALGGFYILSRGGAAVPAVF